MAPTDAGERLVRTLGPALEEIDAGLASLSELREKPVGSIRITTGGHATETVLLPALERLLPEYPDIKVAVTIDYGLTDVVAERYDAGIRLGEASSKGHGRSTRRPRPPHHCGCFSRALRRKNPPRVPQDLAAHRCINMRLPTSGVLYAWEFEKRARTARSRRRAARVQP